jgi:uncharacterized membrane protein
LWLTLFWLAFLVRGAWYCGVAPPWEGYDEPYHFSALQNIAAGQGMPHTGTRVTLEVQDSLHLLPLAWMHHFNGIPGPLTPYDDFWRLPPEEQERRLDAAKSLDPGEGREPARELIVNYESQQPPLYYWVMSVPMRWMSGLPLLSRIYWMRILSVLLASAAIPLGYWIAKRVLGSELPALGVAAVTVLLPELLIDAARVCNESIALVCFSVVLVMSLRVAEKPSRWGGWLLLGVALGAGLLSKAYMLATLPGMFVVGHVVFRQKRNDGNPRLGLAAVTARMTATFAIAGAIAGWWYWRVHAATGSLTGVNDEVMARHLTLLQKLSYVTQVNWKRGIASIVHSHLWFGGWSFLRMPKAVSAIAVAVAAVAIAGAVARLRRRTTTVIERQGVLILTGFYASFCAGLLYHILINFLSHGVAASAGWYLYATVSAEMVLLVWGLQAFLPNRIVFPGLAVALAAVDLYPMHAYLMPYYSGLSVHVGDWVYANSRITFQHLPAVFARLGELQPVWLGAPGLWLCWIAYWVATLGTVAGVFVLFRRASVVD